MAHGTFKTCEIEDTGVAKTPSKMTVIPCSTLVAETLPKSMRIAPSTYEVGDDMETIMPLEPKGAHRSTNIRVTFDLASQRPF